MTIKSRPLLTRTAITITLAFLAFMVITLSAAVYFVAMPIGKRSADDLAALMILAANTWHETLPDARTGLRRQLLEDHGVSVAAQTPPLPEQKIDYPYFFFLRNALVQRTGEDIRVLRNPGGPRVWVDIPVQGDVVRLGIDRKRISASPPIVLILVVLGGTLLALLASFVVVRRVVGPLERLSQAVREVGKGGLPPPLAEDGPEELAALAHAFNDMSLQVHELLENRTVMVAGISHDLRTPLTRLGLAVEMLSENEDPKLIEGVRRDLTAMENLIRQFMELARGLADSHEEELDLDEILAAQTQDYKRQGYDVRLSSKSCTCLGDRIALERILANLLDNAVHYGDGKPVDAELQCDDQGTCIRISDRGPGIPDAQRDAVFRPFHRLDSAREERTGGSGLGLAIARQLANKNGWEIELEPRTGGGTVAIITL